MHKPDDTGPWPLLEGWRAGRGGKHFDGRASEDWQQGWRLGALRIVKARWVVRARERAAGRAPYVRPASKRRAAHA